MASKGILDYLKRTLGDGFDALKESTLDAIGYNQWQNEAADISRSLGLVYREQSPLPLPKNKKYGDPLMASNNAITHAYLSAKLAQRYGALAAKMFGDGREWYEAPARRSWPLNPGMSTRTCGTMKSVGA
jgi:hypothetical protein